MKNFLISLLVTCLCLGIVALILAFGFGQILLDIIETKNWIMLIVVALCVFSGWLGAKLSEKTRKK